MTRERLILVTGFGPFPGAPFNPSGALVKRLARRMTARLMIAGVRLECRILPTVYATIASDLARLETELAPDAMIHFGLAGRRRNVTVEVRAHNRFRPLSFDAAGRLPPSRLLEEGAPFTRPVTAGAVGLAAQMARVTPTGLSNDAGAYVCNQTLWHSLARAAGRPAVFIHIPRPRRAASPCAKGSRRPTMQALLRMAEIAVMEIARVI